MHARGLVGAVLAPHDREDAEFGIARFAAEQRLDFAVLGLGELVLGDEFGCDGHRVRAGTAENKDSKMARPSVDPMSGSQARSGCGIMPITLRSLLRMPAMSRREPLGLSR